MSLLHHSAISSRLHSNIPGNDLLFIFSDTLVKLDTIELSTNSAFVNQFLVRSVKGRDPAVPVLLLYAIYEYTPLDGSASLKMIEVHGE